MTVFVAGPTGVVGTRTLALLLAAGVLTRARAHWQLTGEGVNTHMYPHFSSQVDEVRHREMLADAERRRIARQLAKHARASRIEQRAERRMSRAAVKVLRLRSEHLA
jgi:hypothetical protein